MKILGIDPGTNVLGYAILDVQGNKVSLDTSGVLDLRKEKDVFEKLNQIFSFVSGLFKEFNIGQAAIESPFYGKNIQSMLKLGRAQGVAIAAVLQHNVPIYEYAPRKVKISVTGNGNASKQQVSKMLESILNVNLSDKPFDETDAIAIALCHYYNANTPNKSQYSSWKDYAKRKGLI